MDPNEVQREIEDRAATAPREGETTDHLAYARDLEYRAQELEPHGVCARVTAAASWGALGQRWGQRNVMHASMDADNAIDEVQRRDYAVRHGGEIDTG